MSEVERLNLLDTTDENIVRAQAAFPHLDSFWDHQIVLQKYSKLAYQIGDLRAFEQLKLDLILFYFDAEKQVWGQVNGPQVCCKALQGENGIYQENHILYVSLKLLRWQIAFITSFDLPSNKPVYDVPQSHQMLKDDVSLITNSFLNFKIADNFRRE